MRVMRTTQLYNRIIKSIKSVKSVRKLIKLNKLIILIDVLGWILKISKNLILVNHVPKDKLISIESNL